MDTLDQVFSSIDIEEKKLREPDVYQLLNNYKKINARDDSIALHAETIAFAFSESFDPINWRSFYKPLISLNMQDRTKLNFPSLMHISSEIIDYWHQRATTATHPILKMRYAGLTWTFYRDIKKLKPPFEMSKIVIDSIALIADKGLHKHELPIITKLKYGLYLALSINDEERIKKITNSILDYEENAVRGDTIADAWSTSFDHLLQNKKISLTNEQRDEIINRLERRLDNLMKAMPLANGISPIKEASTRLAKFYQLSSHFDKLNTALIKYIQATLQLSDITNPIVSQTWLSEALATAKLFKMHDEEKQISIKLLETNQNLGKHLQIAHIRTQIPDSEIQEFLDAISEGNITDCLKRFRIELVVNKDQLQQQVFEFAKDSPLSYSSPISITDYKGRQVATIGALNNDLEGRLIWQAYISTQTLTPFKRIAISKIFTKHQPTAELLTDHIFRSPFFDAKNREVVETGLDAYINNQPIVAIHVLIPQIEEAIRNILYLQNMAVYKNNRSGGINLKTLDELLREKKIVTLLGSDTIFYLRALLTDPRGLNLRNNVCHGTINPNDLSMNNADLVFLILLILSELRLDTK